MSDNRFFTTEFELAGEPRKATVVYIYDGGVEVKAVVVEREEKVFYDAKGDYRPHINVHSLDVTTILSKEQLRMFAGEVLCSMEDDNDE